MLPDMFQDTKICAVSHHHLFFSFSVLQQPELNFIEHSEVTLEGLVHETGVCTNVEFCSVW